MRKIVIAIVILVLIIASGAYAYRGYKHWKQDRAMKMARSFIAKADFNSALICVKQALRSNPKNIEAVQMMANFAELAHDPSAVTWRTRLLELNPQSLSNRMALVRVALAAKDYAVAKKTLDETNEAGKQTALYHKSFAAFAIETGQYSEAENHFQTAFNLEPTNTVFEYNLASIRMQRKDPKIAAEARATMERLCQHSLIRPDALRQLALDALKSNQVSRALSLVNQLVQETNSIFKDRLLQLDILRSTTNQQFQPTLMALQQQSATNLTRVFELSRWMLNSVSSQNTLAWLNGLAPSITTNWPVTMVAADAYIMTTNWTGLQTSLEHQNWGDLEYMRWAYRARALREQGLTKAAEAEWKKALKATENQLDHLSSLQRTVAVWGWPLEQEEILWVVVNKYPTEKTAVRALSDLLYHYGKTRSLLSLYEQLVKTEPANLVAKNNLAAVALLVNSSIHKPHELATEVYSKETTNAFYASTYAFSLYLRTNYTEALNIFNQFSPRDLERPTVSGYYGLALTAEGRHSQAKKYLEIATKYRHLPEEEELFRRAMMKLK